MSKKKFEKGAHRFAVKAEGGAEVYEFNVSAFIYDRKRFETADLFEGEDLKSEHAEMVTDLVKIDSGIIKKSGEIISDEPDGALESAQAEYETLTGKKPGTMKLGTLLKKIEEAKSKTD